MFWKMLSNTSFERWYQVCNGIPLMNSLHSAFRGGGGTWVWQLLLYFKTKVVKPFCSKLEWILEKNVFTPEYLQTDFKTKRWWELKLNEVPVLPTLKAERLVSVETFRKCLFLSEPSKWISLSCYMDLSKLLNWFVKVVTLICQSCSLYFLPFAKQNKAEVWQRCQRLLKLLLWTKGVEWVKVLNAFGPLWPNMHIWVLQIWSSVVSLKRSCKM